MEKIKTLVSLSSFVLHLHSMTTNELCTTYPNKFKLPVWNGSQDEMVKDMLAIEAIKWDMTKEYAKFLIKPLTLSMFIPVDDEGNALKGKPLSPAEDSEWIRWENEQEVFFTAREKVLFEGLAKAQIEWFLKIYSHVEDLSYIVNTITPMTLTPTALKQIYG